MARFKWDDNDGRGPYRKTLLKTFSEETFERLKADNRLIEPTRPGAKYSYKQYLAESSGHTQVDDVWTDVNAINPVAKERIGWPTQKPEALLERIIEASSNRGDIVLDPFCGCGTTVAVAERLQRPWVGIDISPTAVDIMYRRVLTQTNGAVEPRVEGLPITADALRELQPFEFQNWVMREVNGTASPTRSGDLGVDGLSYMYHEPIQVKQSERVGRPVLDEFETAVRRSGKDTGYIISFSFSSKAREEASRARSEEGLNIVLVTVDELLGAVESVTRPRAPETKSRRKPTPDLMRLLSGRTKSAFPPAPSPRSKPSSKRLIENVQAEHAGVSHADS